MWKFVGNSQSQAFLKPPTSKPAFKQDIHIIYMHSVEGKSKWSYIAKRALSNGARRPLKKCDHECRNPDGVWTLTIYSKFPTYTPSSFELSKMQTCVPSHWAWVKLHPAFRLLLLMILQLYHLPPPLPPPTSNSSCLFTRFQPLKPAVVPYYHTFQGIVRLKRFSLFFVLVYVLCEKYYKPITVQSIQPIVLVG